MGHFPPEGDGSESGDISAFVDPVTGSGWLAYSRKPFDDQRRVLAALRACAGTGPDAASAERAVQELVDEMPREVKAVFDRVAGVRLDVVGDEKARVSVLSAALDLVARPGAAGPEFRVSGCLLL